VLVLIGDFPTLTLAHRVTAFFSPKVGFLYASRFFRSCTASWEATCQLYLAAGQLTYFSRSEEFDIIR